MNFYRYSKNYPYGGTYQLRGHITEDKEHYNTRIKKIYGELYNIKLKLKEMKSTGVYGFQIWSNGIVNFKNKILKLPLGKKTSLKIPNYLIKIKEMQISIVCGIFDTDGSFNLESKKGKFYPRIIINNTSYFMIKQLYKILKNLNFKPYLFRYIRPEVNWNDLYTLTIKRPYLVEKWFKVIKPKNKKHLLKYNHYLNNS